MAESSALGDYLRARRELVRPGEAGLPEGGRRRVPGLRREEVALLAGISAEYYLRLEQGRDRHPSDPVLDGIARALRLDTDATAYLHTLARPPRRRPTPPPSPSPSSSSPPVGEGVQNLIDNWTTTPAYVQGRGLTVLAANAMATALSPYFAPGVDTVRAAFLAPEMREFYRDWDAMTAKVVPYLRSVLGSDGPRAAGVAGVLAELRESSERFSTLWERHDVRHQTSGLTRLLHPRVGPLDLHYEKLTLPGRDQVLITYHARPGSDSERRLLHLAGGVRA